MYYYIQYLSGRYCSVDTYMIFIVLVSNQVDQYQLII